jgi:hypothetical protein
VEGERGENSGRRKERSERSRSGRDERSDKEGNRKSRKINVKSTMKIKANRIGVSADLVWQRTTTWHSPVTGVSWCRVARTNTAVLPMPFYHITSYHIHSKIRKEKKQEICKTEETLEKKKKQ